ncbi:MAG: TonB-dependent receptor [Gemmatimonadaceae bacterium]|nr:TonB-dependent receptor [Gemmatimonadaceae bacterium]
MSAWFVVTVALVAAAPARLLPAQVPPAPRAGVGVIAGEVIDSLFTRAPLADADIVIEGLARVIRSDARGRFRVDSVPVGSYRIAFFHPTIDDVGLQAAPVTVRVLEGEVAQVALTTPSPASAYTTVCGAPAAQGRGLVIGAARGATGGAPVTLTRVIAQWDEVVVRNGRIARESPAILGRVTASGGYLVCNVPTDGEVLIVGVVDDGRRGVLNFLPDGALVSARVLRLADDAPTGVRGGAVVGRDGTPVTAARVEVGRDTTRVLSDATGAFAFGGTTPATGELRVRGVGFRPVRTLLDSAARSVVFTLDALSAQELAAVTVQGERPASEAPAEFEARRKSGFGNFVTRDDILKRNPMQLSHMLERMPGMMVDQATGRVRNLRGASMSGPCEPIYFVDGVRFDAGGGGNSPGPLTFIPPEDVAGIEVYRGAAQVPQQYGGSNAGCGAIVVWTRRGKRN